MAIFELYFSDSNKYRWRLKTEEKDIFADSGKAFTDKNLATEAIEQVRLLAGDETIITIDRTDEVPDPESPTSGYFEIYLGEEDKYYWSLKAGESLISDSTHGLANKGDALRDIAMVQALASTATFLDLTGPYYLGPLPPELTVAWPSRPKTRRILEINSPGVREVRVDRPKTRVIISANLDQLTLAASDIEVLVNDGMRIGRLFIERALSRFRIKGGTFGNIELAPPVDYTSNPAVTNESWLVQDVLVDGVTVITSIPDIAGEPDNNNTFSAFYLRGKRIAILNSHIQAYHYAVWTWANTNDFQSEDIILAGNVFESAGPEATVRLVSVLRSVAVNNRFVNGWGHATTTDIKHNYRIHARSDLNFAARNTLIKSGIMIGTMRRDIERGVDMDDMLGTVWFQDNFIYHITPSLLEADTQDHLTHFIVTGNVIFSEAWDHLLETIPEEWTFENNYIR
jgi:uncharacterized protein YegP (UPF0339 family)